MADNVEFRVDVQYDDTGHIIGLKIADDLEHADQDLENFLTHYGVKGMRWGLRRGSLSSRVKSARLENNKAVTNHLERLRAGKDLTRVERAINVTNHMTMGKTLTNKYYDWQISGMKKETAKIEEGRLNVAQKLSVALSTPVISLAVERRS